MRYGISWHIRRRAVQLLLALGLLLPAELAAWWVQAARESRQDTINGTYMPIRLKANFAGEVGGQYFSTNNLGFREAPPVDPAVPPGGRRILVLGDSISFGFGLPVTQTYPVILESLLVEEDPQAQVLNAAGQGYSPSSYWAYAHHEGLRLRPDTLLVQVEASNDVSDEAFLSLSLDSEGAPCVKGGRFVVTWDGNLLGSIILGPYGYEKTYLYTLSLRNILSGLERYHSPAAGPAGSSFTYFTVGPDRPLLTPRRIEAGWDRFFRSLLSLRELARQQGVRMLLLVMPNRFVFEGDTMPLESRFAAGILERIVKTAEKAELETVDVRGPLAAGGGARLYLDFAHLNRDGQEILARTLHERLQ